MLAEEPEINRLLKGMVRRMTADVALREDLYQEAWIRLWMEEARQPGQTASWYLQNCQFHLRNSLKQGRSVDSPKRRRQRDASPVPAPAPEEDSDANWNDLPELCCNGVESDIVSIVCAQDAVSALHFHLTQGQRRILDRFMDGSGVREVGRELGVSHVSVVKQRRRIASIAARLGIGGEEARPSLGP